MQDEDEEVTIKINASIWSIWKQNKLFDMMMLVEEWLEMIKIKPKITSFRWSVYISQPITVCVNVCIDSVYQRDEIVSQKQ